ncbi:MAG: Ni/Fe hydrogenase subunit alpha [candidate division Zixibacteria bacterium]|nr:Ni/Fe hydrogenase subunit alpha [candidate division Zixibacteria bacterium]
MKSRIITVDYLARVEGEGGLSIRIKDDKVVEAKLKIFEPPRFFEGFLRGRSFTEVPDITARICGICPVAYQMSSSHAMETACGVSVEGPLRDLRRLLYCGEWIESHALHIYMLHAPDFLGYQDAVQLAQDHPDVVNRGLQLKKVGNDIITLVGGREIHPINPRVGGFYKVPAKKELDTLTERLKWATEAALETIRWSATLPFPDYEQDYEFVALRHPDEYPLNDGRVVSNRGLDISAEEFLDHFEEEQVKHSTSLHARIKERGEYLVGPMARYSLNFDKLPAAAQEAAGEAGLGRVCTNPFKSIIVRGVETLFACLEAQRIIEAYQAPESPCVEVKPRAATGHWCTEAPRGLLYHRYQIDDNGDIKDARIIPPTSQNQKAIENDLSHFVGDNLHLSQDDLTWRCEQMVRNYDPCISCSCHFLKLDIERE